MIDIFRETIICIEFSWSLIGSRLILNAYFLMSRQDKGLIMYGYLDHSSLEKSSIYVDIGMNLKYEKNVLIFLEKDWFETYLKA